MSILPDLPQYTQTSYSSCSKEAAFKCRRCLIVQDKNCFDCKLSSTFIHVCFDSSSIISRKPELSLSKSGSFCNPYLKLLGLTHLVVRTHLQKMAATVAFQYLFSDPYCRWVVVEPNNVVIAPMIPYSSVPNVSSTSAKQIITSCQFFATLMT